MPVFNEFISYRSWSLYICALVGNVIDFRQIHVNQTIANICLRIRVNTKIFFSTYHSSPNDLVDNIWLFSTISVLPHVVSSQCFPYIYMYCIVLYCMYVLWYTYIYINIYIYIYIYSNMNSESKLLNCANPRRNWAFQRFARVAEKERTQRNKMKIWHSLAFEPRSSVYRADALSTELRCRLAELEFLSW